MNNVNDGKNRTSLVLGIGFCAAAIGLIVGVGALKSSPLPAPLSTSSVGDSVVERDQMRALYGEQILNPLDSQPATSAAANKLLEGAANSLPALPSEDQIQEWADRRKAGRARLDEAREFHQQQMALLRDASSASTQTTTNK